MNEALNFKLEEAMGFHVNRTASLMTEEMNRRIQALGYTVSTQDFAILFRIFKKGSMLQTDISRLLMRDKTTVTRRIDGLVKKKYVRRIPSPDDRRYFLIALTPTGQQMLEVLIPLVANFQKEIVRPISSEYQAITIQTLQRISHLLIDLKTTSGDKHET